MDPLIEQCCVTTVDGVCSVAGCVGRELAPHVKKHGGKLIPESMRKDKDGRSNIDGAMVVAASGVQGRVQLHFVFKRKWFVRGIHRYAKYVCIVCVQDLPPCGLVWKWQQST